MQKAKPRVFSLSTLFLVIALTAPGQAKEASPSLQQGDRTSYALTVIPFYSPEKMWTLYAPLVTYLKRTTGQPWELKLYHDHDALLEGLCKGEVTVALLGPVPLGRAYRACGAQPLLVALGMDGKPVYRSVIATSDPSVTEINMLRGKKFALYKGSTAAHIIPLKMLKDAGLGTGSFRAIFFGGQDRIISALLTREADAAGMKEALYRKFRNEPITPLRISDPLPNFAFCRSPAVNPELLKRFTEKLLALKPLSEPRDAALVRDWDDEIKNGFMAPDAEFLPAVINVQAVYQEIMHDDH